MQIYVPQNNDISEHIVSEISGYEELDCLVMIESLLQGICGRNPWMC